MSAMTTPERTQHDPASLAVVEEQFVRLFQRAKHVWRTAAESVHPEVAPAGYRMLNLLVQRGPANGGQIAEVLESDKSVVSRQAKVLGGLGLLVAEPDPSDGRGRRLRATEDACVLVGRTRASMSQTLFGGLEGLSADEVDVLARALTLLNERTDAYPR